MMFSVKSAVDTTGISEGLKKISDREKVSDTYTVEIACRYSGSEYKG